MNKRLIAIMIVAVSIVIILAAFLWVCGRFSVYGPWLIGISAVSLTMIPVVLIPTPHVEITEADANPSANPENVGVDEVNETGVPVHDDSLVSEEAKRHGVLLECKNAWLSDRQFYYCRNFYQVSDMVAAKVDHDELAIKFTNGKMERFVLALDGNVADVYRFKLVSKGTLRKVFSFHSRAKSRQWVRVINGLVWSNKNPPKQDTP